MTTLRKANRSAGTRSKIGPIELEVITGTIRAAELDMLPAGWRDYFRKRLDRLEPRAARL